MERQSLPTTLKDINFGSILQNIAISLLVIRGNMHPRGRSHSVVVCEFSEKRYLTFLLCTIYSIVSDRGGFCSWGIALEKKPKWPWQPDFLGPPASPWEGWAIVDGLLTFNIWADYTRRFLLDQDTNMRLAKERWADMWGSDTGTIQVGPFNTHCIGHGPLKNWCLSQQPSPWLEALPECIDENNVGGGIVSQQDDFSEFSNSQKSPYQEKWLRAGAIGIPSFLAFLCFLVGCCRCFSRKKTTTEELDHVLAYNNDDDKNENGAAGSGSDRTSSDDEREPSSSIELARSMA